MKPDLCTEGRHPRTARRGCSRRGRQRGDALFEALVGIVVASVVGLGLAYSASRLMLGQLYVSTQNAVLDQMVNDLTSTGVSTLCAGTAPPNVAVRSATITMTAPTCQTAAITVSLNGGTQSQSLGTGLVTAMTFSTPSGNAQAETVLGGNGVMTISQ
jgi:Tfp pilus assembly protein PilV